MVILILSSIQNNLHTYLLVANTHICYMHIPQTVYYRPYKDSFLRNQCSGASYKRDHIVRWSLVGQCCNSTMNITTLILLLVTGILGVIAVENEINERRLITNCCELSNFTFTFARGSDTAGVYLLNNFCGYERIKALAYCDITNGGGGWLVVQRRQDGSVDFNRTWLEYEDGFGMLTGEFWYGLRALHCLTGQGGWEMRMDIKLANGTKVYLQYTQFKVESASNKYRMTVGGFQGITTDPMAYHNGTYFTTIDNDNDRRQGANCALHDADHLNGGWWYS